MLRRTLFALVAMLAVGTLGSTALAQTNPYGGGPITGNGQVVAQGDSVTVTFTGLPPSTPFHVTVQSKTIDLGTMTSDANGNLTVTVNTAGLAVGQHTVTVTGGGVTAVATFTVVAAAARPAIPRTGTSSTVPLTSAGLALVGAGGLFVLFARRRRSSRSAA